MPIHCMLRRSVLATVILKVGRLTCLSVASVLTRMLAEEFSLSAKLTASLLSVANILAFSRSVAKLLATVKSDRYS